MDEIKRTLNLILENQDAMKKELHEKIESTKIELNEKLDDNLKDISFMFQEIHQYFSVKDRKRLAL